MSGVVAAMVVVGVFVASSTLLARRVPREAVASRASVAAGVGERAPVPGRLPEKVVASRSSVAADHVEPRVSVVVAGQAPEAPSSMLTNGTPHPAFEETLPEPSPTGAPTSNDAMLDGASWASDGGEYNDVTLDRPALDAPRTGERAKGATAKARSSRTAQPRRHHPCDCLPGDPLCGCLD